MNSRDPIIEALLIVRWTDTQSEHLTWVRARSLQPGRILSTPTGTVRIEEVAPDGRLPVLVHCTGQRARAADR